MLRFLFAVALALPAMLVPLAAQIYTIQPQPMQAQNKPHGSFSLSYRSGSSVNVRFEDVGAIPSRQNFGDTFSEVPRSYDDGFVTLDTRGDFNANAVTDDGRTNRWAYAYSSQVTPENDLAFHAYSTASNGTDIDIDSGSLTGVEMQYDYVIGVFGPKVSDKAWSFTWGAAIGAVFSPVNAKVRDTVKANLLTTTDVYSLEGAAVPGSPYTAPSTIDVAGVTSGGASVTYTVDNTTLLNNRPYRRTSDVVTPDAADVDGFWQVKGGYYTLRVGPTLRWQFGRHMSVRATIAGSVTFLGLTMEYDELVDDLQATQPLRAGGFTEADSDLIYGYYGALDAEYWLTDRTGFFAGVTLEETGDDVVLTAGSAGRRAVVEMPSGTGFRVGMTVRF
jgi:hypothetical protein